MSLLTLPRAGTPARTPTGSTARTPVRRRSAQVLQRDRHEPEYGILVAIVGLLAIGILMVYSSSAMKGLLARDDTFAIVGPQIAWGVLGVVAMLFVSRLDYRYLRLFSIPMFAVGVVLLLLVLLPPMGPLRPVVVGGSARWLVLGPLPAVHPAEYMKLALVVYLAHWFASRGTRARTLLGGTIPFLLVWAPVVGLVLLEPDLGTSGVLAFTGIAMFFIAGARIWHLGVLGVAGLVAVARFFLQEYQQQRIQAWLDPFADPSGIGFHSVQGYLALALGGVFGAGLGESRLAGGLFLPNAWNDFIFAIIGEEFGLFGGTIVIVLFLAFGYLGIRTSLRAPDTFGALLAAGITAWICIQAFVNIGVVVGLFPVTGIPLPFVSAGGSSLLFSCSAVGVLLAVSRETVEKGTWNDAPADRGRGNGRPHLPGPRRRPIASRPAGRA